MLERSVEVLPEWMTPDEIRASCRTKHEKNILI